MNLEKLQFREMRDEEDVAGYLEVHNTHWKPVSMEFWREWTKTEEVTMALALMDGKVVGGIPFHIRDFRVRPDAVIKAAFEFSVIVREDLRDRGIGSRMMDTAKNFLKGRVDVMMVYRGGELTPGYNFYFKNEHYDVSYLRPRILKKPYAKTEHRVKMAEIDELFNREEEALKVFKSAFDEFGGYPERVTGYWRRALNSMNIQEIPQDFTFFYIEDDDSLVGYAIVSKLRSEPLVSILEWATLNGDKNLASQLITGISRFAAQNKCAVRIFSQDFSLYDDVLKKSGFIGIPRSESSMMIMAHLVDPESLAKKVWRENENLRDVKVTAWSPRRQVVIHQAESGAPRKEIALEMKDDILTRLLLSRIDILSAVKQELITVVKGEMNDIRELALSLPYTPWEYHEIDYI